ncbi:MAG: histidine kinase [Actinomycetia bacterium]|nr:histidine kinase [Actinomycetes bacterium]
MRAATGSTSSAPGRGLASRVPGAGPTPVGGPVPNLMDGVIVGALLLFQVVIGIGSGYWISNFFIWSVIGLIQVVPLLWRRAAPGIVAGLMAAACLGQLVFTADPHPGNFAVPVIVFSAAAYGSKIESRGVLGLALVGAVLATLRWGYYPNTSLFSNAVLLAVIIMVVALAWALGEVLGRRRAVMERQAEQERALARDQAQRMRLAAQDERASIAREMHDIVAHSLAVVVVQADGALYAARTALDRDPDEGGDRAALQVAAATLETLAGTARSSLSETRRLVGVLREEGAAAEYSPFQGLAHLEELATRVRASGPQVHVAVRGRIDDLPREVDLAAYRVVQESLTNVLKHAGPDAVADVDVLRTPAVLLVRISDSGVGAARVDDGEGHGIIGMTERIEVLGGSLTAGPRPRGGWEVVATVPVQPSEPGPAPEHG